MELEEFKCSVCPYKNDNQMTKALAEKIIKAIDKHTDDDLRLDNDISIILEEEFNVDFGT